MKTLKKVVLAVLAVVIVAAGLIVNPVTADAKDVRYYNNLKWLKDEYTVCKGYSFSLYDDAGVGVEFQNSGQADDEGRYKFSYSKKGIVKYDEMDQSFYGKKVGTTTVKLTVKTDTYYNNGETLTKSFKIHVIDSKPKFKSLKSKYAIGLKETKKLDTTVVGAEQLTTNDGYGTEIYNVVYSTSSNEKVATVDEYGVLTAKGIGTTKITVDVPVCKGWLSNNNYISKTIKVTVTQPDKVGTKYTEKGKKKITLKENEVTLLSKKSLDIKSWLAKTNWAETDKEEVVYNTWLYSSTKYGSAQIRVKNISGLKSNAVVYKSNNTKVATVNSLGKVTPKKAGIATITVTSKVDKKVSAKYTVKVVDGTGFFPATKVTTIGMKYDDGMGETIVQFSDGKPENVILTSSDENIVRTIHGKRCWNIEPVSCGTVTLTVKSKDGFSKYSWKCTVTADDSFEVESWR